MIFIKYILLKSRYLGLITPQTEGGKKGGLFLFGLLITMMISTEPSYGKPNLPDSLSSAARQELREVLQHQPEWVKVHAAEYLLWTGTTQGIEEIFLNENERHGAQSPYRIGIWRVLAQVATGHGERDMWIDRIQRAFQDTAGTDRVHAAETLAKLHVPPASYVPGLTRRAIESNNQALALYARWAATYYAPDSIASTQKHLLDGFKNTSDALTKQISAYILRQLGPLSVDQWQQLARASLNEPAASPARVYLLSAAFVKVPREVADSDLFVEVHKRLLKAGSSLRKGDRTEMSMALAERGTPNDLPILISLLKNKNQLIGGTENEAQTDADNADVRAAAAYAVIKIQQRH